MKTSSVRSRRKFTVKALVIYNTEQRTIHEERERERQKERVRERERKTGRKIVRKRERER